MLFHAFGYIIFLLNRLNRRTLQFKVSASDNLSEDQAWYFPIVQRLSPMTMYRLSVHVQKVRRSLSSIRQERNVRIDQQHAGEVQTLVSGEVVLCRSRLQHVDVDVLLSTRDQRRAARLGARRQPLRENSLCAWVYPNTISSSNSNGNND